MKNIILETKKITDIKGIFVVPSYQRGYRWEKEAIKLLEDINEIDDSHKNTYCLQPIVLRKIENEEYELIDGQQRLTTIYLILKVLRTYITDIKFNFKLKYAIRDRSEQYLQNISEDSSEDNIDFYFIKKSFLSIKKWFELKWEENQYFADNFYSKLSKLIDVIWYEVDEEEDGNLLFQRLNIGKIPLTSSELVKAMFLSEANREKIQNRQEEISLQWDNIEKELHDNSFWYFLTNNTNKYQTRIDLILNMIANSEDSIEKYSTFFYFDNLRKNKNLLDIWKEIQNTFLTLKDWYKNHDLYHRIGYLIATGVKIDEILNDSKGITKTEFKEKLIDKIKESLKINNNYGELSYDKVSDYNKISKLLLFFNVESTRRLGEESQWFAFDKFKEKKWSLEHIHAQQSKGMKTMDVWKTWLKFHQESLDVVGEIQVQNNRITKQEFDDIKSELNQMLSDDDINNYGERFENLRVKIEKLFSENMNIEYMHSISNLALLETNKNAALNNSTFDVKRNKIIKMIQDGEFIPYCTLMVFLKYYTNSDKNQVHFWGQADRESYVNKINEILKDYIEPIKIMKEDY